MKTIALVTLLCLIGLALLALIIFFTSAYYLKICLTWDKDNLEKIYLYGADVDEALSEIEKILEDEIESTDDDFPVVIFTTRVTSKKSKRKILQSLNKCSHLLEQNVPCYFEHGKVPSDEIRTAEDSKCNICNESTCIFHS